MGELTGVAFAQLKPKRYHDASISQARLHEKGDKMTLVILILSAGNFAFGAVAIAQRQIAVRHTLEKEKRRREKIQEKLDAGHMKKVKR